MNTEEKLSLTVEALELIRSLEVEMRVQMQIQATESGQNTYYTASPVEAICNEILLRVKHDSSESD